MKKRKTVMLELVWMVLIVIVSYGMIYYIAAGYSMPSSLSYGGDGLLGEGLVKSIQENGLKGALISYRLGAPQNSILLDTPFLDWINIVEIYIVSFFVKSPGVVNQIVYWISYPLSTLFMYGLLRMLKCNRGISTVTSFVFAFAPYHFFRNTRHGTLSNYFMIPVAIATGIFILDSLDVKKPFSREVYNKIFFLLLAFLIGFTNIYYAAFSLIFLVWVVFFRIVKEKSLKHNLIYVIYPGATIAGVGIALAPKMVYTFLHGENTVAAVRPFIDSERYGLKIIQMLLPSWNSRIGHISNITMKYMQDNPYINENICASLGIIASVGFIIACIYLLMNAIRHKEDNIKDCLVMAVLILTLFCTVGGFGTIFNLLITPEIRCYNRGSIFIACISLVVLALYLSAIKKKYKQIVLLLGIIVVAFFDQISIENSTKWDNAKQNAYICQIFYGEIEKSAPDNAMIYQIPFMSFPENGPINDMPDYEQLSAYVFTDTIRWSYGGVKGRNTRAQELYVDNGMSEAFLDGIKAEGFCGVCIDLKGFTPEQREMVLSFYSNAVNEQPIVSLDGNLYFYDIN